MTVLSESERWRQKYFDQLAVTEQEETRLRQKVRTLQSLVDHIILASRGGDDVLDAELRQLSAVIRQDDADEGSLEALAQQLKQSARQFDLERCAGAERFIEAMAQLVDQLLVCDLPAEQLDALKALSHDIKKQSDNLRAYPELLAQYSELQGSAVRALARPAPVAAPRRGFFERIFGAGDDRAASKPERQTCPLGTETEPLAVAVKQQEAGAVVNLNRLTRELKRMLSELPLSEIGEQERDRLLSGLESCRDGDQLVNWLQALAEWVLGAFGQVKSEIGAFLETLSSRLREVDQMLDSNQRLQSRARDNNTELEAAMRRHVGEVQASLSGATDLQNLKHSINSSMTSILDSVAHFMVREAEREQDAVAEADQLRERLRELEADSRKLQQQVAESQRLANTDPLSGLPNRAAYDDRVVQEFQRWKRGDGPLSLAVFDLDKLKDINDRYGHLAGDKAIQLVARETAGMLGPEHFIARYGGEEFVILLPGSPVDAAMQRMERIRQHVAGLPFHFRGETLRVTASIGVCEFSGHTTITEVFERADQALYRAKRSGRNRIERAEDSVIAQNAG
ncbi:hypothetical protein GCM10011348_12900 [Marinobacterium nitratireducens]|uniref:diguanylate cyclase n=1 Tax=Marinobacterium nitratireducens TaxID=518897 RepID=A0A917ZB81_9GAMM|nr:GGDEF domain-containing protein [Marinobacterium nitratireducens]GGO79205.1 hypothetical protein GCM10011348_12900 [Marinobacterium nitratireducens]